jgi:hypothetical protein
METPMELCAHHRCGALTRRGGRSASSPDVKTAKKQKTACKFIGLSLAAVATSICGYLSAVPAAKADGDIWRYTGTPCGGSSCPGWQKLDDNPLTRVIAAGPGPNELYQIHFDPIP